MGQTTYGMHILIRPGIPTTRGSLENWPGVCISACFKMGKYSHSTEPVPHKTSKGCYIWHGWKGTGGFGLFNRWGATFYANQITWEDHIGKLPPGKCLSPTTCKNPACVRADHLEPVTFEERANHLLLWRQNKRLQASLRKTKQTV
jgi:hypothetical protein